jgi:hypothetical protein
MKNIRVMQIGAAAAETMSAHPGGRVAGVTSKGAFLRAADRIIFLTTADYRSPFNLMLDAGDALFTSLQPGDAFEIREQGIQFSKKGYCLDFSDTPTWRPPEPVPAVSTLAQQKERVIRLVARLQQIDPLKGFLFLSQPLERVLDEYQFNIYRAAGSLVQEFRMQQKEPFLASALQLIGAGGGLTPSGDDFLTGFFLYHFRLARAGGNIPAFLADWCDALVKLSFEKTTTISANRLEYAARGWSEELFLLLIDHLFDSQIPIDNVKIKQLADFGHSSGIDTMMGIAYAVDSLL